MIQDGFYLVMKNENLPINDYDMNIIINQLLGIYQSYDNEVIDLMNASKMSEKKASDIVRKRYKDFIIN